MEFAYALLLELFVTESVFGNHLSLKLSRLFSQGGTSIAGGRRGGGGGGLGPGIEFRGKIWGKVQSSSPNKKKNLGSSVTTRRKNWERISILGTFWVISEIQRAKFGVSVTYIFGGKIWGTDMNFRGKIWDQPPDLLVWKYPLWDFSLRGFTPS